MVGVGLRDAERVFEDVVFSVAVAVVDGLADADVVLNMVAVLFLVAVLDGVSSVLVV